MNTEFENNDQAPKTKVSNAETGNARTVSNFRTLLNSIIVLGIKYNPSNVNLQIPQLNNLLTEAEALLLEVIAANSNYSQKIVDKNNAFKDLGKLFTSVINTLQASGVDAKTIENAQYFNRKIQGKRASPKTNINKDASTQTPKTISTSQLSASQQIQHLAGLISLLELEPNYNPNELHLKVTSLQAKKIELENVCNQVEIALAQATIKRIARNEVLYTNDFSVCNIALEVKNYIKAVFGVQSIEYKSISKLSFRKSV